MHQDAKVKVLEEQNFKLVELLITKTSLVTSLKEENARLQSDLDAAMATLEQVISERDQLQTETDKRPSATMATFLHEAQQKISTLSLAVSRIEADADTDRTRSKADLESIRRAVSLASDRAEKAIKTVETWMAEAEKKADLVHNKIVEKEEDMDDLLITNYERDPQDTYAEQGATGPVTQNMDVVFCPYQPGRARRYKTQVQTLYHSANTLYQSLRDNGVEGTRVAICYNDIDASGWPQKLVNLPAHGDALTWPGARVGDRHTSYDNAVSKVLQIFSENSEPGNKRIAILLGDASICIAQGMDGGLNSLGNALRRSGILTHFVNIGDSFNCTINEDFRGLLEERSWLLNAPNGNLSTYDLEKLWDA